MPKVLYIAMSGVRIVNPALRALGLTLPGFIERGQVIASLPSLGLLTLAGATPPPWECAYREFDQIGDDELQAILTDPPDLVAVSSLSARIHDAYQLCDGLRSQGVPVVIGGLHASAMPDEAGLHADAVVTGQGEWVWPRVLADAEAGALQARYSGMHDPRPLDDSPMPRWELLDVSLYNRIPIQSTRGCPLDCSFCGASRLISPYKRKSPERIRRELEAVCEVWPKPFVELADDNTFVSKSWSKELARVMTEFPEVRWFTETDISLADDPELLELLAASGCAQVLIGLESPDPESLAETDSKDWKKRQRDHYLEKIAVVQAAGISVNGCFAVGFDADGPGVFDSVKSFVSESCLSEVQATILTPFPGTTLQTRLREEGRLLNEEYWDSCTLFDLVFRPARMGVEELEQGFHDLIRDLYSPEASEKRKALRAHIYRSRPVFAS